MLEIFKKKIVSKLIKSKPVKALKKIRASINKAILECCYQNSILCNVFSFFMRKIKRFECKPIVWIDKAHDKKVKLFTSSVQSMVFGPKNASGLQPSLNVETPSVELFKFEDAIINAHSSHLIAGDCVYMERLPLLDVSKADYSTGFVVNHDNLTALINLPKEEEIETIKSGIFLGGNGAWNYYHWMIEILPKIEFFQNNKHLFESKKIILPIHVKNIKSFWESFAIFYTGSLDDLIFIDIKKPYRVSSLYFITTPSNVLFNSRQPESRLEYFYFNLDSLQFIKSGVFDSFNKAGAPLKSSKVLPKKFFLARKEGSVRSYNQDAVIHSLAGLNIVPLFLEDLTLQEQVTLFNNAELIIGPSGAAWTNLIFCQEGAKAISWLPEHIGNFSAFSTLANWSGVDMVLFLTKPDDISEFHGSYQINTTDLVKLIINKAD
jgi:glycosyl transferase family 61